MPVSTKKLLGMAEPEKVDLDEEIARLAREYSLTDRQKQFVHHYVLTSGQKTVAAVRAGYGKYGDRILDKRDKSEEMKKARSVLAVQVANLMKNPKIREAIDQFSVIWKGAERSNIEADVFRVAKLRAMYDIREFADTLVGYSPDDIAEKLKALPEDLAVAIDSFSFKYWGKDADRFTVDIKFADRQKSIEFLTKLTGLTDREKDKEGGAGNRMPTINIVVTGDQKVQAERKVN